MLTDYGNTYIGYTFKEFLVAWQFAFHMFIFVNKIKSNGAEGISVPLGKWCYGALI